MEVTRVFRPEYIRSEELVELLYNLLRESREPVQPHSSASHFISEVPTCFDAPLE